MKHAVIRTSLQLAVAAFYTLLPGLRAEADISHLASQTDGKLDVYIGPGFTPDSGISYLFADRLSRVDFLFYQKGEEPIKDFEKAVFTVDFPKGVELSNVALMSGWKKPTGKFHDLPVVPVERDGKEYLRYTVPLPGYPKMARAEPTVGGMFGGICYNMAKLFVRAKEGAPKDFTVYWQVAGAPAQAEGRFPVRLLPFTGAAEKPKRLFLVASQAECFPEYADPGEIKEVATILRDIGISYVPVANRSKLVEKQLADVWTEVGMKFYGSRMDLMAFNIADRSTLPEERDYLVGLDGERAKGSPSAKFHGRLYCPLSLNTPGRTGFERQKEEVRKQMAAGASWVYFDLESQFWTQCFCGDCLKEFAGFSKISDAKVAELTPFQIISTYPETWYRFRTSQTGMFYENLRKALAKEFPEAKISADSYLVDLEKKLANIGPGVCSFAEDPRLIDGQVDLHTVDALTGSVADPISIDVYRQGTHKPLIGTAGSSYCVGYNHANIVGRRIQAEQRGLKLGYDRRGDLQRLGIVHTAASGATGIRVSVLEENETIDAEVANLIAEAAEVLAKLEESYLDGKRSDEEIEIIDLTEGESPYETDTSIVAGGPWKHFHKLFGTVQYRVHQLRGEHLVSLFNWDLYQDKQWLVRFKNAPDTVSGVRDRLTGVHYSLEGREGRWSKAELEEGVLVTVPSAGFTFLSFSDQTGPQAGPGNTIATATRAAYLAKASEHSPSNPYAWQSGEEVDVREMALHGIKRGSEHLKDGAIPEKYRAKH